MSTFGMARPYGSGGCAKRIMSDEHRPLPGCEKLRVLPRPSHVSTSFYSDDNCR